MKIARSPSVSLYARGHVSQISLDVAVGDHDVLVEVKKTGKLFSELFLR